MCTVQLSFTLLDGGFTFHPHLVGKFQSKLSRLMLRNITWQESCSCLKVQCAGCSDINHMLAEDVSQHIQQHWRPATHAAVEVCGLENHRISAEAVCTRLGDVGLHARCVQRHLDLTAVRNRPQGANDIFNGLLQIIEVFFSQKNHILSFMCRMLEWWSYCLGGQT